MAGYASHIPTLLDLCDWLNSIPNSWNNNNSNYHYNSNYTTSLPYKLLQMNGSNSPEFRPTGVCYTNTEANKLIKEEDVTIYKLVCRGKYYDYGTVENLNITINDGSSYNSRVSFNIDLNKIKMSDNTPVVADVSEFERYDGSYLYLDLLLTSTGVQFYSYACEGACYDNNYSIVIRHIPTNSLFTFNWRCSRVTIGVWVTVLVTARHPKTIQYLTGWVNYNGSWERFGAIDNGGNTCVNVTVDKGQKKYAYLFSMYVEYSPCDYLDSIRPSFKIAGVFADSNGNVIWDSGLSGNARWWYYTCYWNDVPNNKTWYQRGVSNNDNDGYAITVYPESLGHASTYGSNDPRDGYYYIWDVDEGPGSNYSELMTELAFDHYYPNADIS